jgi:hypothetical protein
MTYLNVHTEWCVVNSPDSESLVLVRPALCDARVIDMVQYRKFVALAMEMANMCDTDEANTARPPHAELVAELYYYDGLGELQIEEINVMIEYDGVITYDIDNACILGVAIGFCAIPVAREASERFHPPMKVDVVERSTGYSIPSMKQLSLRIMGDFVRHDPDVIPVSKAWGRRSKRVHDLYTEYNASVNRNGQADCLQQFESTVIVCGFLHEGADRICHSYSTQGLE